MIRLKKIGILICLFSVSMLIFLYTTIKKEIEIRREYSRWENKFTHAIKESNYLEAYQTLYPLTQQKNIDAMKLLSTAYQTGESFGVSRDLIKSRIWDLRIECICFKTGIMEYKQFLTFLEQDDYGMAAEFLQKAAENGNEAAINKIKDKNTLVKIILSSTQDGNNIGSALITMHCIHLSLRYKNVSRVTDI